MEIHGVVRTFRSRAGRWGGAVALCVAGLSCVFFSDTLGSWMRFDALNAKASELVDASLERNQTTFLVISGIKAGLALIEGSSVGVGVELELGDIVQPVYDYVDFFWRMFLYAFLVLGFYKLLLETGLLHLGIPLLGVGSVLVAISLLTPNSEKLLRAFGKRCVLAGVLMAFIVPGSLIATQQLSAAYTTELKQKHYENIEAFGAELNAAKADFIALKEKISIWNPSESLIEMRSGLLDVAQSVADTFRLSLFAFMYYGLLLLFDVLLFPLLSAFVLYKVAQLAMNRAFESGPPPVHVHVDAPTQPQAT